MKANKLTKCKLTALNRKLKLIKKSGKCKSKIIINKELVFGRSIICAISHKAYKCCPCQ